MFVQITQKYQHQNSVITKLLDSFSLYQDAAGPVVIISDTKVVDKKEPLSIRLN